MASIPVNQARGIYTSAIIGTLRERIAPTGFLRSFFRTEERTSRYLNIEVRRGTERVAVDVLRGSDGNRNTFGRSTEKVIEPPYFREYFDVTSLDIYNRMFGSERISDGMFSDFVSEVSDHLEDLTNKIRRAYEVQCAQVLQTGTVTLVDGTAINFGRKAGSIIDNSANPWTTGTVDPYAQIAAAAVFLRTVGKSAGATYNLILGSLAVDALFNNTIVKSRGPLSNINFDSLRAPQRNAVGAAYLGSITAGAYNINLWTYPEYYDKETSFGSGQFVSTPYIDPRNVILIPENPNFIMGFAAVPQLIDEQNPTPMKGEFIYEDFRDSKHKTHEYYVNSAGIAIPLGIDQAVTMKVVAG